MHTGMAVGMALICLAMHAQAVEFGNQARTSLSADEAAHSTSRNEESTPRASILPGSPAIAPAGSHSQPADQAALVTRAKAVLTLLGYDVGDLDDRETAKFRAAVFRYQEVHGLYATGLLGAETLAHLEGRLN